MGVPVWIDGKRDVSDKSDEDRMLRIIGEKVAFALEGATEVKIHNDRDLMLYRFLVTGQTREGRAWRIEHAITQQLVESLDDTQFVSVLLADELRIELREFLASRL